MSSPQEQWFSDLVRSGLETKVVQPTDVVAHATPPVLAASLPKELMAELLQHAMESGSMTPEGVLTTLTPDVMARHLPRQVVWACLVSAAERAGVTQEKDKSLEKDVAPKRDFLHTALSRGLETGVLTPKDVVKFVDGAVLGHHFPQTVTARLLEASLSTGKMSPEVVVEVVGTKDLAAHAPAHVLWACVAQAGEQTAGSAAAEKKGPPPRATTAPASLSSKEPAQKTPPEEPAALPPIEEVALVEDIDLPIEGMDAVEDTATADPNRRGPAKAKPPTPTRKSGIFSRNSRG